MTARSINVAVKVHSSRDICNLTSQGKYSDTKSGKDSKVNAYTRSRDPRNIDQLSIGQKKPAKISMNCHVLLAECKFVVYDQKYIRSQYN